MSDGDAGPDVAALIENATKGLRDELAALRSAFVEEGERRNAGDDDEAGLEAAAKRAGLSLTAYRAAIDAAKREQFKEDNGPLIRELLDDILSEVIDDDDAGDGNDDDDAGDGNGNGDDDAGDGKGDDDAGDDDSPPIVEHWSDRPFSKLLGRG